MEVYGELNTVKNLYEKNKQDNEEKQSINKKCYFLI